jgi:hypothetical protein
MATLEELAELGCQKVCRNPTCAEAESYWTVKTCFAVVGGGIRLGENDTLCRWLCFSCCFSAS